MIEAINLKLLLSVWMWVTFCMSCVLIAEGDNKPTHWLAAGTAVTALLGLAVGIVLGLFWALAAWSTWVAA